MQRKYLLLLLISPHCLCLQAEPELKGTPAELTPYLRGIPKTVAISGEAELRVPADQAVVTLKVSTDSKSLQDALRVNQEVRAKLLSYFKSHNLPPERVHASRFSSTPRFGLFGEKAKSYRVENLVRVIVEDEREFQLAASTVDSFSEVQFVAADFEAHDKESLKTKVVAQACDNANKRRTVIEEKLGLTLKPERFSSGTVLQTLNSESARRYVGDYTSSSKGRLSAAAGAISGLPMAEEDVSSFGELIYSVEVTIEYSVQPK